MLYYSRIYVSEEININKTSAFSIFAIIGISEAEGLGFNHMYAMTAMMY